MFKTGEKSLKGEAAREQILERALQLFRQDGFDSTTMRDVASAAGVALGLAYYYFPSKDALVMAYYEQVQARHAAIVEQAQLSTIPLKARLALVLHTKIDILQDDRKLLGALFRYTGDPGHPLSFLGDGTEHLRRQCIDMFRGLLRPEKLPTDLDEVLPMLLWAGHMGVLLYFLYDKSTNLQRTRGLIDGGVALVVRALALAKFPLARPMRRAVLAFLRDAGLTCTTTEVMP